MPVLRYTGTLAGFHGEIDACDRGGEMAILVSKNLGPNPLWWPVLKTLGGPAEEEKD